MAQECREDNRTVLMNLRAHGCPNVGYNPFRSYQEGCSLRGNLLEWSRAMKEIGPSES